MILRKPKNIHSKTYSTCFYHTCRHVKKQAAVGKNSLPVFLLAYLGKKAIMKVKASDRKRSEEGAELF
jgi:hypothetical protein